MLYNVGISSNQAGSNLNLNVQVEATNVLEALDKAKQAMADNIKASGLTIAPPAEPSAGPTPQPAP